MGRRNISKNKICFQIRENIWDNDEQILKLKRKKWKPLIKKVSKINSDSISVSKPKSLKHLYRKRLYAKQALKAFYGFLPEYKLKNLYNNVKKNHNNNVVENLLILLESKIDTILYRSGIAKNIFEAKQLITHNKIKVNGKLVNSCNFIISEGDFINYPNEKSNNLNIYNRDFEFNKRSNTLILLKKPSYKNISNTLKLNKKFLLEYLKNF